MQRSSGDGYGWGAHHVCDAEIGFDSVRAPRVAFRLTGSGLLLAAPAWWLSNQELDAQDQQVRFWRSVAAGHSLLRYDHLGVGASDRDVSPDYLTLELVELADSNALHESIEELW